MKRGTIEHPKTVMLQMLLGCSRLEAVGILEALFHWTARYARRGDIGRYPNSVIAEGVFWKGDPDALISALIEARGEGKHGWVEEHPTMRLVVHDWADHADESTKKTLANNGETFWDGSEAFPKRSRAAREASTKDAPPVPEQIENASLIHDDHDANESRTSREQVANDSPCAPESVASVSRIDRDRVENDSRMILETGANDSRLPEPEPEPEPEPIDISGGQSPPGGPGGAEAAKPPDGRKRPPKGISPDVMRVIDALNELSGRRFDPGGAQAQYVRGRLRSGATVEQLLLVIEHRVALWGKDPKMRPYLRPETLFGAAKFEDYLPLAMEWDNAGRPSPETWRPRQAGMPKTLRDRAAEILAT